MTSPKAGLPRNTGIVPCRSEPVAILLVNSIAEEIKLATLNFRRFFPNCRVEAVYTVEEAL